jgi:FkbM family methyltransferase
MFFIDSRAKRDQKISYSQCGEDLIVDFIFSARNPKNKFYVDIGAHHPSYLNNTFFFYKKGWRGVNVDPLSEGIALFNKRRREDVNVAAGLGARTEDVTFYVMDPGTLSTFDEQVADSYVKLGHKLKRREKVGFLSAGDLIRTYNIPSDIALLSIDIEGNEYQIVSDFVRAGLRPDVLVCETGCYSPVLPLAKKNQLLISNIVQLDYILYADTFVNSIFVSKQFWGT